MTYQIHACKNCAELREDAKELLQSINEESQEDREGDFEALLTFVRSLAYEEEDEEETL